jgi:predicted nucleic acid-binding protein
MRIFLDANILFSAVKTDGAIRQLLQLLRDAGHDCRVDGYVIEEARRNLAAKAPGSDAALHALLQKMTIADLHPSGISTDAVVELAEKDRPVLAAAIRSGCDALVTGDSTHFGRFYGKTLGGVAIHSPRSLAEKLLI